MATSQKLLLNLISSSLAYKYYIRVEVSGIGKHSSLLQYGKNDCLKNF